MTILPSVAISIRAIFTPALVAPLMAFVTSCCLKIDGARVIGGKSFNRSWIAAVKLHSVLPCFNQPPCCSVPFRPGSSRRAFPPKLINCRPAVYGCTKSSTKAFGVIARKNGRRVRLYSRPANDFTHYSFQWDEADDE
jgi:hypothetical protein